MRRFILLFLLLALTSRLLAQHSVFVLVDVSKSIRKSDMNQARQALTDVLAGNKLSNSTVSFGKDTDLPNYKLAQGDTLYIIKFGDKSTTLAPFPPASIIRAFPADVYQQIQAFFPDGPTDNRTYLTLAQAKVAEFASQNKLNNYKLYLITDNITDDYGPNGKPDYNDYERRLTQSYGTTTNPVIVANSTKIKLNNLSNQDYVLEFIVKVDISGLTLPVPPPNSIAGNHPQTVAADTSEPAQIRLTTNAGGRKNKEIQLKDDNLAISWSCTNYPQGGKYKVIITSYEGEKFREVRNNLNTGFNIKLPDGKFKVMVLAANFTAGSATTYVQVDTGGYWWISILLIIAGAVFGGYTWLKKKKDRTKHILPASNTEVFTKKSPEKGSSSTNSDYWS